MKIPPVVIKVIKRCQGSPIYFIDTFCKIQHPKAGVIPFKLWHYQRKCLSDFQQHRFNIFRKCRQSGISTLTGAFALWLAMFFNNKTVLIVSKRDDDAKTYLKRNVKFIYDNLPDWMRQLWTPSVYNEHSIGFKNGSIIRSLTSSPDTLRSNASSLNIIDEAAFIDKMEIMWRGGYSTLQHGGAAICVSTPKGATGWYHDTWQKAIKGQSDFHPITINWWDMNWKVTFLDELTKQEKIICPTDGLKKLTDPRDIEKYGPYWSPWLEEQYRELSTKGSDVSFRQEILADFIGTGDTVLSRTALLAVQSTLQKSYEEIDKPVNYRNPATGEIGVLDFGRGSLRIWEHPFKGNPDSKIPEEKKPHLYVLGADPASGEAADFSAIQILNINTRSQVAEFRGKVLPKTFARMVDYLGRYYNNALVVCERTGIGQSVTVDLDTEILYPNLYRQRKQLTSLKFKRGLVGFPTSHTSKHILVKELLDNVGEDGFIVRSERLFEEFNMFIHLPGGKYGNEPGAGNTDDLVLAFMFALIGVSDAIRLQNMNLIPIHRDHVGEVLKTSEDYQKQMILKGGKNTLLPHNLNSEFYSDRPNKEHDLAKFVKQLGGVPPDQEARLLGNGQKQKNATTPKHILKPGRH